MTDGARGEVRPFERPAVGVESCPSCSLWRIDRDDLYCSRCGESLFGVSLSADRVLLFSGFGERPARRTLTVENRNDEKVRVSVTPLRKQVPGLIVDPAAFEVPAQGAARFEVFLNQKKLPDDLVRLEEELLCRIDGHPRKVLPFRIEIRSGPRPEVITREARFGKLQDGERGEAVVRIANRGATPLGIAAVEVLDSRELEVMSYPERIDGGQEGRIQIAWDTARGGDELVGQARLRVRFGNHPEELTIPVSVQLERLRLVAEPDAIRIAPAIPKEKYERTLRLVNRGTLDVGVAAVESDQDWIHVEGLSDPIDLPAADDGGAAAGALSVRVRIDPTGLAPGEQKGEVRVRSSGGETLRTVPVELEMVDAKPYFDYIGIDFGTTNSVIAYVDPRSDAISLVEVEFGKDERSHLIPSVLTFRSGPDDYVIGHEARHEMDSHSDRTIRSVKVLLGSNRDHELFGRKFPPEAIAGLILRELVRRAEAALRAGDGTYRMVERAIVTVPAAFFDRQIEAILSACQHAGLETHRRSAKSQRSDDVEVDRGIIIDEPSAAALYYLGHLEEVYGKEFQDLVKQRRSRGVHLLVFDYGGGTLDVSLARLISLPRGRYKLTIRETAGNDQIGGDRIDLAVLAKLLDKLPRDVSFDPELVSCSFRELQERRQREGWSEGLWSSVLRLRGNWKDLAEKAKIALSVEGVAEVEVRVLAADLVRIENGRLVESKQDLFLKLTLDELRKVAKPFTDEATKLVERVLDKVKPDKGPVDYLLHTGRQSLMPAVRDSLRELLQLPEDRDILEPAELKVCVAKGAALFGRIKDQPGGNIEFDDQARRLPCSYGISWRKPGAVGQVEFLPILREGVDYPVEKVSEISVDDIPSDGFLTIRIYKQRGTSKRIGSPEVRPMGQARIDTMADGQPGCTLRFAVDEDRLLKVTADGIKVDIDEAPWEEQRDDDWSW